MIRLLILAILSFKRIMGYNDFPSLITANASMAVIIEKEFFENIKDYQKTLTEISDIINNMIKKNMQMSGIDFTIFTDINVNLGRDYTVLLSVATCQSTWRLLKGAEKEKLIHLAISDPDCPRIPEDAGISLPLVILGKELPQIFFDLRMTSTLVWPKINIIYDDTFARDTINRVVKALSVELPDSRWILSTRALFSTNFDRNEAAMRQRIRRILADFHVDQLANCFMVIVSVDMVPSVLETAKSLKMLHPGSRWLFVVNENSARETNFTSLLGLLDEGHNVAFLYNATSRGIECNMSLMCHVEEMVKALARSLENSLLNELELYDRITDEEFEVVRLSKAERKVEIIRSMNKELMEERSKGPDFGCSGCASWRLISAITWGTTYESTQPEAHFEETGTWSPGPGIRTSQPLFPHVTHGFRGAVLPVVTFHNPPWQIIKISSAGGREYGGLIFDILDYLSLKLNFSYVVKLPEAPDAAPAPHKFPSNNNSTSKKYAAAAMSVAQRAPREVTELVRTHRAFLAAVALTVGENMRGLNFTASVTEQTYALLSHKPKLLSRALLFTAPFTGEVWACLVSALVLIGPILYVMIKLSPRPVDPYDAIGLSTLWQCSWYVYGAILQQGGMNLPKSDSARLVVGTWWVVVMVVVATYSGNLIAFLTFPRMDAPVDSVDDLLARSSEFHWSFPNGSALESYLAAAAAQDDKYKQLLSGAARQDPTQPMEILERIKHEDYVLIDWKVSLAFLMSADLNDTGMCNFHLSSSDFMRENLAMIVAGDSPYLPLVNNAIKRMHESGLIKKWTAEKIPMKDKCWESMSSNQEATNHKVNMGDMQGIFFVLAIGFTMAAVTIGSEYCWHRRKLIAARKLIRPFVL